MVTCVCILLIAKKKWRYIPPILFSLFLDNSWNFYGKNMEIKMKVYKIVLSIENEYTPRQPHTRTHTHTQSYFIDTYNTKVDGTEQDKTKREIECLNVPSVLVSSSFYALIALEKL